MGQLQNSSADGPERVAWTVGHSNHSLDAFLALLETQRIAVLVDVRSSPYCKYSTHFDREPLRNGLRARNVKYLFLGDQLGGRPEGEEFYDKEGHVRYDRIAASPGFQQGIERLLRGIAEHRVVLTCGEEDPLQCHRRLLLGRVLGERGVKVLHIRGDGRIQTEDDLADEEKFRKTKGQMNLFDTEAPDEWRSTQSVSRKKPPPGSSGPVASVELDD